MKLSIRRNKEQTLFQRFTRAAIFWGIPMVCLEFIGIPRSSWGTVLVLVVPATLVGVLAGVIIEHSLVSRIKKKAELQQ
jgi:type IV secretory pathway VirB3-like protein